MAGHLADNAGVQLNIGGTIFETARQTLCRDPESFLARLVSEEPRLPSRKDKSGAYVIDRDPDNFAFILRYLRTGFLKGSDGVALEELLEEADFYNLPGLVKLLEDTKSHKSRVEYFIVIRHVEQRCAAGNVRAGEGLRHFCPVALQSLHVRQWNERDYYLYEEAMFESSIENRTWAEIHAKVWSALLGNGFKLEKDEPNSWTFVRTVNK